MTMRRNRPHRLKCLSPNPQRLRSNQQRLRYSQQRLRYSQGISFLPDLNPTTKIPKTIIQTRDGSSLCGNQPENKPGRRLIGGSQVAYETLLSGVSPSPPESLESWG